MCFKSFTSPTNLYYLVLYPFPQILGFNVTFWLVKKERLFCQISSSDDFDNLRANWQLSWASMSAVLGPITKYILVQFEHKFLIFEMQWRITAWWRIMVAEVELSQWAGVRKCFLSNYVRIRFDGTKYFNASNILPTGL